jgi:hypothetical protein
MKSKKFYIISGVVCGLILMLIVFIASIFYAWSHPGSEYVIHRVLFMYSPLILPFVGYFLGRYIAKKKMEVR